MPIKGLTDKRAALPRVGVLRKGAPKPNDKQPGRDLQNHFRFDTDDSEAAEAFRAAYGDRPNNIRLLLPYATAAENFETWREDWVRGSLKHRCDGEVCVFSRNHDGSSSHRPVPCPGGCRPHGRLMVIIPALARMAYVEVSTTSWYDIEELQANLEAVEAMRGDLRGIPMILSRYKRMVSCPVLNTDRGSPDYGKPTGQRARREKWLLRIEAARDWVQLQLTAMQHAALPGMPAQRLLTVSGDGAEYLDPETGELIAPEDEIEEAESGPPMSPEKERAIDRVVELMGQLASLGQPVRERETDGLSDRTVGDLGALIQKYGKEVDHLAQRRFFARYGEAIAGKDRVCDFADVRRFIGSDMPTPTTYEAWKEVARRVQAVIASHQEPPAQRYPLSDEQRADADAMEAELKGQEA